MPTDGASRWTTVRLVVNWVNLATPLGLLVAAVGRAHLDAPDGRGIRVAGGYRFGFPIAGAFTLGNIVITRHDARWLRERPSMLAHEDRHATQFGWCLGPGMLVFYLVAAAFSWVVAGDHSSYNPFERLAGLSDGGYPQPRTRRARRAQRLEM
jgi:hypothetical protein